MPHLSINMENPVPLKSMVKLRCDLDEVKDIKRRSVIYHIFKDDVEIARWGEHYNICNLELWCFSYSLYTRSFIVLFLFNVDHPQIFFYQWFPRQQIPTLALLLKLWNWLSHDFLLFSAGGRVQHIACLMWTRNTQVTTGARWSSQVLQVVTWCPRWAILSRSLSVESNWWHHFSKTLSSHYVCRNLHNWIVMNKWCNCDTCVLLNELIDGQQKNRYVQMFCHTRINWATSLKFSGSVYHPMEQRMYKFHVYISNGIDFIPPFLTYPYLLHTNHEGKVLFNSINLNNKKWLWNY